VVEEQPTEQNEKNTDEVWMSKSGVFESSVIMFFCCICSHINKSINEFQFFLRRYIIHITTRTTTTTTTT